MNIAASTVVAIDYTLRNDQGEVLDTSEGREPLVYLHGANSIIPGLERALEGKTEGDELSVRVPPEEAYGARDEAMIQAVPRAMFGENPVQVGARYRAAGPNGEPLEITVVEADQDRVTVDANHPLAGEHLNFDVTVREVREASEEEVSHGHAHGPGGHDHDQD
jgi:FKBP-type peptidyl-prolyl cis-trans isomerase SlyD